VAENQLVVVTGAAGFIGSHLCDALLAEGRPVRGVDRHAADNCANLQGALANPDFEYELRDVGLDADGLCDGADAVCHLAAMSSLPDCISDTRQCHADT